MAYDDVITRNDDGDLAVRTVSVTEGDNTSSYDDVFTRDTDGKLAVRVVGNGGDSHNLGWYATPEALTTAYPTATAGDWAIVGSTDTVWLWDTDNSQWVDSDTKGQVTSVNGQTGAVTVQETLVNQTNIKSVDGNSLLGSGNLELSTYLTYPAGWTTNSTTKAFCDGVAADTTAVKGKAYLGEVTFSDLPASMVNAEVVVEIMDGTTAQDKIIVLSLKSGNVAPYAWQYVYWDNGTNVSGWKTWQEPLVSGTNIKTINGTSLLGSGDITTEAIQVSTMPTASATELGKIYQYIGTTDANYTNGYFYECVSDGQVTPTYSWSNIQVQASSGGLQNTATGTDSLTILGTAATAGDSINIGVGSSDAGGGVVIGKDAVASGYNGVCIGKGAKTQAASFYPTAIGNGAEGNGSYTVAIGYQAKASGGAYCIQLGKGTNTNNKTFCVGFQDNNYEMLSANGTIPTDRFTTTPSADGTYVPTLTISSGVATRSWTAPSGGSVPTLTWYTVSTAGNTLTIADTSSAQLVKIYKNGLLLQPTEDYTISGTTLTTVGALVVGDKITTEIF